MNAGEFKRQVLQQFYYDMHQVESNNYSYERYSYDGVDRSKQFNVDRHATFMDWFTAKYENVYLAWSRLADQTSRDIYLDLIRYRLAGHLHVRIRTSVHTLQHEAERFRSAFSASPSKLALSGMFGSLVHYDGIWRGIQYTADTVKDALLYGLVYGQYNFNRGGISVAPQPGEHVIDAGAFTGESSIVFSRAVGGTGVVYAFEPVANHAEVCKLNFSRAGYHNVTLFEYAVGDTNVDAPPVRVSEYAPGYRVSSSQTAVSTRRIDDSVSDGDIARVDFLKMDVEGAEMAALHGAEATIRRLRPKLALSIYHKPDDLFEIVNYVHDLRLGYKLFIDHHTIFDEETVLYALVP